MRARRHRRLQRVISASRTRRIRSLAASMQQLSERTADADMDLRSLQLCSTPEGQHCLAKAAASLLTSDVHVRRALEVSFEPRGRGSQVNPRPAPDYDALAMASATYTRVALCTLSQEERLLSLGRLRSEAGYDTTDPFLNDDREGEVFVTGAPLVLVGSNEPAVYEKASVSEGAPSSAHGDALHHVRSLGSSISMVLPRSAFMPLPTCPPRPGETCIVMGLDGEYEHLNGALGFCGQAGAPLDQQLRSRYELFWVTFFEIKDVPETILISARNLGALPKPRFGDPLAPLDAAIAPTQALPVLDESIALTLRQVDVETRKAIRKTRGDTRSRTRIASGAQRQHQRESGSATDTVAATANLHVGNEVVAANQPKMPTELAPAVANQLKARSRSPRRVSPKSSRAHSWAFANEVRACKVTKRSSGTVSPHESFTEHVDVARAEDTDSTQNRQISYKALENDISSKRVKASGCVKRDAPQRFRSKERTEDDCKDGNENLEGELGEADDYKERCQVNGPTEERGHITKQPDEEKDEEKEKEKKEEDDDGSSRIRFERLSEKLQEEILVQEAEILDSVLPTDVPQGHRSFYRIAYSEDDNAYCFKYKLGRKSFKFCTYIHDCEGSFRAAERIVRACYVMFQQGRSRRSVISYHNFLCDMVRTALTKADAVLWQKLLP